MTVCDRCGREIDPAVEICECVPRSYSITPECGHFGIIGFPSGTIIEGPLDAAEGRRVEFHPASGGRADSATDPTRAFTAELTEPLVRGRNAEAHAVDVLIGALRERGDCVEYGSNPRDDRGEDACLIINGRSLVVQVVSVPADPLLWRELASTGAATTCGTGEDAVNLVRQAVVRKKDKARGTILLLDAEHIGSIVTGDLPERYRTKYGDPEEELDLVEAWIVGPSRRSVVRLGVRGLTRYV